MAAAVRRANQEKVVVSKRRMSAMETKIHALSDKARMADELAESVRGAWDRQRRLLPAKPPPAAGADIDILYRPAALVSGDFYDFVPLAGGRLGFFIGDVSGHGIEAGILMGMAKKVLAIRLEEHGAPAAAIRRANQDLFRELDRQSFVTAFAGVYDPAARTLEFARAGHNPPVLYNPARTPACEELQPSGQGLGLSSGDLFDQALEARTLALRGGDILVLYTDGLVEARDPSNQQFGAERLMATLESSLGEPPPFLLSRIAGELDRFAAGAPPDDDVTVLCLRFP
jgi:sigma-B regulation protein RsbU (phosphoserine phosphatase)